MKIALVHDHLMQEGGAERVLEVFHDIFPEAPIFTLLYNENKFARIFPKEQVHTSYIQNLPLAQRHYQFYLPLMPNATERHDLSEYDVILSSSSAFSKGVITRSTTLHICYCHTPTRYLWMDTHSYVRELQWGDLATKIVPFFLTNLRVWDRLAADRVDKFLANSKTVQERIKKYYRRPSDIIYPPVDLDAFTIGAGSGGYYLAGGRLVAYKRFEMIIEAFNRLGIPLKIFGDGPERQRLEKRAKKNIEFVGKVDDTAKAELYRNAIAFLNPQEEDFGITAIEAMASGRPVIALAAGGALETVVDGVTGVLFYDQDWPALLSEIINFKPEQYNPEIIRQHALKFSTQRFKKEITSYIDDQWKKWKEIQHIRRLREMKMML